MVLLWSILYMIAFVLMGARPYRRTEPIILPAIQEIDCPYDSGTAEGLYSDSKLADDLRLRLKPLLRQGNAALMYTPKPPTKSKRFEQIVNGVLAGYVFRKSRR